MTDTVALLLERARKLRQSAPADRPSRDLELARIYERDARRRLRSCQGDLFRGAA